MQKQNINAQLKALKSQVNPGAALDAEKTANRARLMAAIRTDVQVSEARSSRFAILSFTVNDFISRPLAAVASIMFLVLGGLTTVSASTDSLPGDPLYGIKRVTEQAQIRLTAQDRRAVLHTEFAERRLQEIVELQTTGRDEKVAQAVEAFKVEIARATTEVERASAEGELLTLATEVDAKLDKLTSTINDTQRSGSETETLDEVEVAAREASAKTVESAVGAHETQDEGEQELSRIELEKLYQNKIRSINDRKAFNIGRLQILESAEFIFEVTERDELLRLDYSLTEATDRVGESTALAVAGGYRRAFELLGEAEANLLESEARISELEIALIDYAESLNMPAEVEEIIESEADEENAGADDAPENESPENDT
jgi:glycine cleavage system H lipoate-binding protein